MSDENLSYTTFPSCFKQLVACRIKKSLNILQLHVWYFFFTLWRNETLLLKAKNLTIKHDINQIILFIFKFKKLILNLMGKKQTTENSFANILLTNTVGENRIKKTVAETTATLSYLNFFTLLINSKKQKFQLQFFNTRILLRLQRQQS